jgi:uncharacterized membrane protein
LFPNHPEGDNAMQCPVCHNEVAPQSAFCGHCGATIAAPASEAAPPPTAYTAPPTAYTAPPTAAPVGAYPAPAATTSEGLSPNAAAAISYITIIPAILFLILDPYKKMPLVRFHAFQCIGLAVCWFAFWVVIAVASMLLAVIPGVRMLILLIPFLYAAMGLGVFILWIMAILKASKGEFFKLPIIGDFAMKQAQI